MRYCQISQFFYIYFLFNLYLNRKTSLKLKISFSRVLAKTGSSTDTKISNRQWAATHTNKHKIHELKYFIKLTTTLNISARTSTVSLDIFHNVTYQTADMTSLDFYFEKKTHAELPWWWRQRALLIDEMERL